LSESESLLAKKIAGFIDDPLGFVYFTFPWGKDRLKEETGPDEWQTDILQLIGEKVYTVKDAIQIAVASGHEIGKTALIAWIILWFMSTRSHPQIVTTANTGTQLKTKTWRELSKWHKLSINSHWFEWTATSFYLKSDPETWFAAAIPWSKEKSEAFAGTHEKHVLIVFDEASVISDIIWETAEGALGVNSIFIAFGNPTKNTGRFRECFPGGRFSHRWISRNIDARTAKMSNKQRIERWVQDYGEDSDFVRIRVRGVFPRASASQFIPDDLVDAAMKREPIPMAYDWAPIVIGVDVARYGDNQTVIVIRQGAYVHKIVKYRNKNTMEVAGYVSEVIDKWKPDAVFIDVIGIGSGVVDRLRQLGYRVIAVNSADPEPKESSFHNLRAKMWGKTKAWLETGILPQDPELKADLTGPEYTFDLYNRYQIESKEDMRARGLESPDVADALNLTLAATVARDAREQKSRTRKAQTEFSVFSPDYGKGRDRSYL
jgi:hypothetical protein